MTESKETKSKRFARARYIPKRKFCTFCRDKTEVIDYKEVEKLHPYVSDRGKIAPRRKSGTCAKHQRLLATAIKRARHLALLPHAPVHVREAEGAG
jgi:small subunit ribosomal protein S18